MICLDIYNPISLHSPPQLRTDLQPNTPKQAIPLIDQLTPIDFFKLTMLVFFIPDDIATLTEIVVLTLFAMVPFVPDGVDRAHIALVIIEDVLILRVGFVEWMDWLVSD